MDAKRARFFFHGELEDFLPTGKRGLPSEYAFVVAPSVKDAIESLGVPHPEVDVIIVHDRSVNWQYTLQHGDDVWVYPRPDMVTVSPVLRLRPAPYEDIRFVLDAHLGRLARQLRMLGFDTLYDPQFTDREMIEIASAEPRTIVTRDRELLKNGQVTHGYWMRATQPRLQIEEMIRRFDLRRHFSPFTRCMDCNGELRESVAADVVHRVPPKVRERVRTFHECTSCGKLYWEGTHVRRMRAVIDALSRTNP
jgi:uncharacterized protein with PIN domain